MPLNRFREASKYKYLDKLIEENSKFEDQLHETPEIDVHFRELIKVVDSLKELKSVHAPDSMKEKSSILREVNKLNKSNSLRYESIEHLQKPGFFPFRLAAAISLFLVFLVICTLWVSTVSAKSLPGTILYPIKIMVEDWKVKSANSSIDKVNIYIFIANRRLKEANGLLLKGDIENCELLMDRYNEQIENINEVLEKSHITSTEEHLDIFRLVTLWLPNQIVELESMLERYSDPRTTRIIENSFNFTRFSRDRIVQLWILFHSSDSFSNYEMNPEHLEEVKDFGIIETWIYSPTQLLLELTITPEVNIDSLESSKTPTTDKDRPLYNMSMTKTSTNIPTEIILPTEMPTPRRTPQPLLRLPTKVIPTSYPTNRPHDNPTRTPVMP